MTAPPTPARVAIAATTLALVPALVLGLASLGEPGPELDEGALVAYPTFVADGEVPWRDWENFYGPGEPYLVAGAFALLGDDVATERAVGLAFRVAIVVALFLLLLPWGLVAAMAAGVISLLALLALPNAVPLADAIALGLIALVLLSAARLRRDGGRSAAVAEVAAGLAAALALAFRPDLGVAVVVGVAPFAITTGRAGRLRIAAGFALGILPVVIWLVAVGFDQIRQVVGDLIASQPGRRLPLPGPDTVEGQVLIASCLAIVATLVAAARAHSRERRGIEATTLLALGLFALALIPPTVQRADTAHLLFLAFLAAVARAARPPRLGEARRGWARGTRWMPVERLASPGDSLFVGTNDMTRSNYNDVFLYYLFPDLRPASQFTEFNPQTANADDSGLATDLERADFIVRTSRYDDWDEPNASDERGPTTPGEVVARDFELVASHGSYDLLRRRPE